MKPVFPLLALALISCSPTANQAPDIQVGDAWARVTLAGKPTSAAYLAISNRGGAGDALIGVTSKIATAELHSTSMDGGIMRMRKLESLPIPAGATVELKPSGTHIMLTRLRGPLIAGQRVELTLRFESSGQQTVSADIRDSSGDHV